MTEIEAGNVSNTQTLDVAPKEWIASGWKKMSASTKTVPLGARLSLFLLLVIGFCSMIYVAQPQIEGLIASEYYGPAYIATEKAARKVIKTRSASELQHTAQLVAKLSTTWKGILENSWADTRNVGISMQNRVDIYNAITLFDEIMPQIAKGTYPKEEARFQLERVKMAVERLPASILMKDSDELFFIQMKLIAAFFLFTLCGVCMIRKLRRSSDPPPLFPILMVTWVIFISSILIKLYLVVFENPLI